MCMAMSPGTLLPDQIDEAAGAGHREFRIIDVQGQLVHLHLCRVMPDRIKEGFTGSRVIKSFPFPVDCGDSVQGQHDGSRSLCPGHFFGNFPAQLPALISGCSHQRDSWIVLVEQPSFKFSWCCSPEIDHVGGAR